MYTVFYGYFKHFHSVEMLDRNYKITYYRNSSTRDSPTLAIGGRCCTFKASNRCRGPPRKVYFLPLPANESGFRFVHSIRLAIFLGASFPVVVVSRHENGKRPGGTGDWVPHQNCKLGLFDCSALSRSLHTSLLWYRGDTEHRGISVVWRKLPFNGENYRSIETLLPTL